MVYVLALLDQREGLKGPNFNVNAPDEMDLKVECTIAAAVAENRERESRALSNY